jgi:signal transduction histidine kinase
MMDARASRVTSSCSVSQAGTAVENELTSIVDALPDIGDDNGFGQSWQAAIHPADLTQLLDRWRAVLASGERGDMQARIRRLDGESGADPPNVDGARGTARRTIRDGNRASEVIIRLRALFSNKPAAAALVDVNDATREVIALLRSELQSNRVVLRAELADNLPSVTADRVQLQQVILNLLVNASDAMSGVEALRVFYTSTV